MVKKRQGQKIDTGKKDPLGRPIYNWIKDEGKIGHSQDVKSIHNDFSQENDINNLSDEELSELIQDEISDLKDNFFTESRTKKSHNPYKYIENIQEDQDIAGLSWNDEEKKDLSTVLEMIEVKNSDEDYETKERKIDRLSSKMTHYSIPARMSFPFTYKDGERREMLQKLYKTIRHDMETPQRTPEQLSEIRDKEFEVSSRLINAKSSAKENIEFSNTEFDKDSLWGQQASDYYDALLDDAINNNRGVLSNGEDSLYDDYDMIYSNCTSDQQMYLYTVFPQKELNDKLEQYGIDDVMVSSFQNGREQGNVYTVYTPGNNTMSFSVYEHRNTDSIIINGKSNWDGKELPYTEDNKNAYFDEYHHKDYSQAADSLAMYLKDAQNGKLPTEEYLKNNGPRVDHIDEMSKKSAEFIEWFKKNNPEEYDEYMRKKNDPLYGLDF